MLARHVLWEYPCPSMFLLWERVVMPRARDSLRQQIADLQAALKQAQENLRWAREQAESDSRKVQQAQEERDNLQRLNTQIHEVNERHVQERDAAIKRAEAAERERKLYWEAYRRAVEVVCALRSRAETASEDATEKEALAENRLGVGLWVLDILRAGLVAGTATVTVGTGTWPGFGSAEAQSGQEEGD